MDSSKPRVVIHVSGGVADVSSIQGDVEVRVLDFDNFNETKDMGQQFTHPITCPHCKQDGQVKEWNAATILALTDSDEGEGVVRIQAAGNEDVFYCAFCFTPSKSTELAFSKD